MSIMQYCFGRASVLALAMISDMWSDPLTSSMIVPCHYTHFCYLDELLENISQQTRLPDEVIIALSGTEFLNPDEVRSAMAQQWPFELIWLPAQEVISRGGNRNRAAEKASGDILICSDADDLMHPRRIELCMRLLESDPWPEMILHGLILSPEASPTQFQWVQQMPFEEFVTLTMPDKLSYLQLNHERPELPYHPITSGAAFFYRKWFERGMRWDSQAAIQEDLQFNNDFRKFGGRQAFVNQPLYYYMYERSAGYDKRAIRITQFRNLFRMPFMHPTPPPPPTTKKIGRQQRT